MSIQNRKWSTQPINLSKAIICIKSVRKTMDINETCRKIEQEISNNPIFIGYGIE